MARPKGGAAIKTYDYGTKQAPVKPITKPTKPVVAIDPTDGIRNAIQEMLNTNLPNLSGWLKTIGDENPEKAMGLFKDFAEYVLAKKQRAGEDADTTKPVIINFERASTMVKNQPKAPITSHDTQTSLDELLGNDKEAD